MDPNPPSSSLGVSDPIRRDAQHALLTVAVLAVVFEVFAYVSTEVPSVRAQSPWGNDPYDAVVSFTKFFVPMLVTWVWRDRSCAADTCRFRWPGWAACYERPTPSPSLSGSPSSSIGSDLRFELIRTSGVSGRPSSLQVSG